jgi:LPXTG-motif cell wall-anchored protein
MDKISVGYSNNTKYQNGDTLATVDIENKAGSALPGTGGIGTTIFYLGGGAMAAIGGIYLVSKRRMRKSEE